IIGGKTDENFGPTILFGLGGIFVETFKDYSVRVCPITPLDAKEMVQEIKAHQILIGLRGKKGANIPLIEKEILKVSKMLLSEKKIKELDLNPLIATPHDVVAVDTRIVT
ncbi:MAG: acetate--CoA ligase family protein, partial [archaeon]